MPDELLTIAQLARVLEVPAEQILAWRRRDLGPPPVNGAAIPRWDPHDVRDWLEGRIADEQAPATPAEELSVVGSSAGDRVPLAKVTDRG